MGMACCVSCTHTLHCCPSTTYLAVKDLHNLGDELRHDLQVGFAQLCLNGSTQWAAICSSRHII